MAFKQITRGCSLLEQSCSLSLKNINLSWVNQAGRYKTTVEVGAAKSLFLLGKMTHYPRHKIDVIHVIPRSINPSH